jgi:hypothetical protein
MSRMFAVLALFLAPLSIHAQTYTLDESYGQVPVTFTPNVGQFDSTIAFAVEGNNGNVLNGTEGVVFQLVNPDSNYHWWDGIYPDPKFNLRFIDVDLTPEVTFDNRASWNNNYFIGSDPARWHTEIPNYKTAVLQNIYDNIDLRLDENGRRIANSLVVKPGGDVSRITLRCIGSSMTPYLDEVTPEGGLSGTWALGDDWHVVTAPPPACWQMIGGQKVTVDMKYRWVNQNTDTVGYQAGSYDPSYDLYISLDMVASPLWALKTTTGVAAIEVDDQGCAYVAGSTAYKNPYQSTLFALKLNEAGDALEYATYFGSGGTTDASVDITIDADKSIYIAGKTNSSSFPTTESSYKFIIEGWARSFITKLDPYGKNLEYTVFMGRNNISTIPVSYTHLTLPTNREV